LDYQFNSEFVHFEFDEFGQHFHSHPDQHHHHHHHPIHPTGNRLDIAPSISWQKLWPSGFFKPTLQLDMTTYGLNDHWVPQQNHVLPGEIKHINHINRALPLFNVDTGLYFDKRISLNRVEYIQTLEPRLFYLYVPFKNQDDIPLFDTVLPPFSFNQL